MWALIGSVHIRFGSGALPRPSVSTPMGLSAEVVADVFVLISCCTEKRGRTVNVLNPRPAGPLDFPPPAGGGGGAFERPPMISAPGRCREKWKAAFESSRKIISKSFRSFFGSGQNWGLQGSKFQNFPKRFFDNKIFHFKDRATNLIPLCLSRQGASNHI